MAAPSALVLRCESCGVEGPHRVLRGRVAGKDEFVFEGVVKCSACGAVRSVTTREAKPVEVPLIVSWMDRSTRQTFEMGPEETAFVGQELSLAEIVPAYLPAIPPDPFDGQVMRFRKLERGFVVYSIGEDREDNGGMERKPGAQKRTDITFIVERARMAVF